MRNTALPLIGCQGAVADQRQPLLALKRLEAQGFVEHTAPNLGSAAVPTGMVHVPWRIFKGIIQDRRFYTDCKVASLPCCVTRGANQPFMGYRKGTLSLCPFEGVPSRNASS